MLGVGPGVARAAVLLDGDGGGVGRHVVGVEGAVEVVDFVGDEAGDAVVVVGDVALTGDVGVFGVYGQWAGY